MPSDESQSSDWRLKGASDYRLLQVINLLKPWASATEHNRSIRLLSFRLKIIIDFGINSLSLNLCHSGTCRLSILSICSPGSPFSFHAVWELERVAASPGVRFDWPLVKAQADGPAVANLSQPYRGNRQLRKGFRVTLPPNVI